MTSQPTNLLTPLKNTVFRGLFISQLVSLLGTGLTSIALALLAFDLDTSAAGAILGTALAIKMVAYVLVAPVVGGIVHHLPRKALLSSLNIMRGILLLCLPFVQEPWQLFCVIFFLNAFAAGYTPIFQALIPEVLPEEEDYTQALSLSRLAMELENLCSPLLAAFLLLSFHYDTLFEVNAVAFFIAAIVVLYLTFPPAQLTERTGGLLHNTLYGIRTYLGTPRTRGVLALHMAVSSAGAMVIVNTVVYVREYLGMDEDSVALTMAAYGFGAMCCALLLPRILNVTKDRTVMVAGAVVMALVLTLGGLMLPWQGLLLLWFVLGIGNAAILTPVGRVLRLSSSEGDLSALFSANFALSHGLWLVAYLVAGWVGASADLQTAFLVLGSITLCSAGLAIWWWPKKDEVELFHKHEAMDHEHLHRHDDSHHQHDHEGWEGPEPHVHSHHHRAVKHKHRFVIDEHHLRWPRA